MTGMTVRAALFGEADPATALGRSDAWRGVTDGLGGALAALSPAGQQATGRQLASALSGLLDLDLGQLLLGGWRRHQALVAAARRTQADPTATELVQLVAHRIRTGHRPYAEIAVNGAVVATVHFELGLTFDVESVVGTVREGRLVALTSGRCTVTASLGCEGRELAARQLVLDLAATVHLGQGVALLQEVPRPAAGAAP